MKSQKFAIWNDGAGNENNPPMHVHSMPIHQQQHQQFTDENNPAVVMHRNKLQPQQKLPMMKQQQQPLQQLHQHTQPLQQHIAYFENAISTYEGDDPLEEWLKYIKWANDNDKSTLLKVLEKCTRTLQDIEIYRNDIRYLRVWMQFADLCKDPTDIFVYLKKKNIGQGLALFYEAWAIVLENNEDFRTAQQVYEEGIRRKAHPVDRLKKHFAEFQQRAVVENRLMPSQTQEIRFNPLKNFEDTHQRQQIPQQQHRATTRNASSSGREERSGYDADRLLQNGQEVCFEELRARLPRYAYNDYGMNTDEMMEETTVIPSSASIKTSALLQQQRNRQSLAASKLGKFEIFSDEDNNSNNNKKRGFESISSNSQHLITAAATVVPPTPQTPLSPSALGMPVMAGQAAILKKQRTSNIGKKLFQEGDNSNSIHNDMPPQQSYHMMAHHNQHQFIPTATPINGYNKASSADTPCSAIKGDSLVQPSPTIHSKQAMADVLAMFNGPLVEGDDDDDFMPVQQHHQQQYQQQHYLQFQQQQQQPHFYRYDILDNQENKAPAATIAASAVPHAQAASRQPFAIREDSTEDNNKRVPFKPKVEIYNDENTQLPSTHQESQSGAVKKKKITNGDIIRNPELFEQYQRQQQQQQHMQEEGKEEGDHELSSAPSASTSAATAPAPPVLDFAIYEDPTLSGNSLINGATTTASSIAPAAPTTNGLPPKQLQHHTVFEEEENTDHRQVAFASSVTEELTSSSTSTITAPSSSSASFTSSVSSKSRMSSNTSHSSIRSSFGNALSSTKKGGRTSIVSNHRLSSPFSISPLSNASFCSSVGRRSSVTSLLHPNSNAILAETFDAVDDGDEAINIGAQGGVHNQQRHDNDAQNEQQYQQRNGQSHFAVAPAAPSHDENLNALLAAPVIKNHQEDQQDSNAAAVNANNNNNNTASRSMPSAGRRSIAKQDSFLDEGDDEDDTLSLSTSSINVSNQHEQQPHNNKQKRVPQMLDITPFQQQLMRNLVVVSTLGTIDNTSTQLIVVDPYDARPMDLQQLTMENLLPALCASEPWRVSDCRNVSSKEDQQRQCEIINMLEEIRFRKKKSSDDTSDYTTSERSMKTDVTLQLDNRSFLVESHVGGGDAAQVYLVQDNSKLYNKLDAPLYALKVQGPPCPWEFYIYTQIENRIVSEMKSSFLSVHSIHCFPERSFLLMDNSDSGSLQDVIDAYESNNKKMDEPLIMYYAIEIIKILEALHGEANIIHGDVKPANFLLRNGKEKDAWDNWSAAGAAGWETKGLKLIDYGRSIDLSLFPTTATTSTDSNDNNVVVCGFASPALNEGANNGRKLPPPLASLPWWTFQLDTYGLCDVIHQLFYGEPLEVQRKEEGGRWVPKKPFKRYWQTSIWERFFDTLLNTTATPNSTIEQQRAAHLATMASLRQLLEKHLTDNPMKAKSLKVLLCRQNIMIFDSRK